MLQPIEDEELHLYKCAICGEPSDNREDFGEVATAVEDGMEMECSLWCWNCINAAYDAASSESRA